MSFNRRGPDRRPDRPDRDRSDRPPQRRGDWQPRERPSGDRPGGDRPYASRGGDRPPFQPRGGDRPPFQPRGGDDRPYTPRPRFDRPPDEGGMSIRLDPRRVNALKHLAGEAGVRPGDLVRQWVEERLDASRGSADAAPAAAAPPGGESLLSRFEALVARVAALESAGPAAEAQPKPTAAAAEPDEPPAQQPKRRARRTNVSAAPSGERVALHDEMIALISERGPMSAADLAQAITARGRYAPPRSGKELDAATVSQRVSNPTYRARFVRSEGRIGLAE